MAVTKDPKILAAKLSTAPTESGTAGRMLMTFFSVGFALLSLSMFEADEVGSDFLDLLARAGVNSSFLTKLFSAVNTDVFEYVAFALCSGAGLVVATYRAKKKPESAIWEKLDYWTTAIIRYFLAYIFLFYGFAKVFHAQFNTPLGVLDTRLGDVSGFYVAWRFFSYSYAYTLFIACSQILSSFLLFFRRTTTLGAMILLPVIANIVFVNFAYDIPVKMDSSIYLILTLFLLSQDAQRIKMLVWDNQPFGKPMFPVLHKGVRLAILKYAVVVLFIMAPVGETFHLHATYLTITTPLAGTWAVQEYKVNGQLLPESDPSAWKRFYVDSDKLAGIRNGNSRSMRVFSTFDDVKHTITITNMSQQPFFAGSYHLNPDGTLNIDGHDAKGASIQATLTRVKSAH